MSLDPHAGRVPAPAEPWAAVAAPPGTSPDDARVDGRAGAPRPGGSAAALPRRRWPLVLLSVALVLALAGGVYLGRLAAAWEERAVELEDVAEGLGADLAQSRADLEEASSALATTQEQLTGAQQRIAELADRVAQTGDDREIQRQVADYQARISDAAAAVAVALDNCIRGQEQLIGYLDEAERYDPAQLAEFRTRVGEFCRIATDANGELQRQIAG